MRNGITEADFTNRDKTRMAEAIPQIGIKRGIVEKRSRADISLMTN